MISRKLASPPGKYLFGIFWSSQQFQGEMLVGAILTAVLAITN
jgi:hypothetical protein